MSSHIIILAVTLKLVEFPQASMQNQLVKIENEEDLIKLKKH